jgi:glucose/arabinose dehydrogenase
VKPGFLVAAAAAAVAAFVSGPAGAGPGIRVDTEVVTSDLEIPMYLAVAPGDLERLFIVERAGRIRIVKNGVLLETPFVDIADQVNSDPPEGAMSSLAFHPDYQSNGYLYVTYTDLNGDGVVARLQVTADPEVADPGSLSLLLTVAQPGLHHNVGWLDFGPDGFLYVGAGDGGINTAGQFAQDPQSMLGKVLRIDVNGPAPYGIPTGNPFVGGPGLDEIWALGLRNPWRCSFDRQTGDMWIGDVGEGAWEEINFQPAGVGGANYGWNCMEGSECHAPADGCVCDEPALTGPVYQYDHLTGCAVIGGYVYRGSALTALQGMYVFSDLCAYKVWALDPADYSVRQLEGISVAPYSFGQDHDGELYILSPLDVRKIVIVDCNDNQIPDDQDIADETSSDCNANGIPDECEPDCNDNGVADGCDIIDGTSPDDNGNGIPDECDDPADLDGDGTVGVNDFLLLLAAWGTCPDPPEECPADLDGDGSVGVTDFLWLLGAWG